MRIALDLRRIRNPGIGRYMRCLVEALLARESEHEFLLILASDTLEVISTEGRRATKIPCAAKYYSLREQIELPRILRAHRADLFHSPHFLLPLIRTCPAVVTIHDVIYLACKHDLPSRLGRAYYRGMITASARTATRIITDSEFSKADIVRRLGIDSRKIDVVHCGVSQAFRRQKDEALIQKVRRKYEIGSEFILYTGIYKLRKNHSTLLRAFQKLSGARPTAELVIAGPLGHGEAELKTLARELGIGERVKFTGFVDDEELAGLYSGACVYACPSLYEGFGLTVLEAMACGTPVVCSRETSLPEVGGDAPLYADARDPAAFADALLRVLGDQDLKAEMIQKGYRNCQRFDWTRAAAQTTVVYEQLCGKAVCKTVCA